MLGGAIGLSGASVSSSSACLYFWVLGLIAAFGELIPVIGRSSSAIPAILVAATVSTQTAVFTALPAAANNRWKSHVLVPKVMGRQVGVSAVGVIVALLIGGALLGIIGAVLAVPGCHHPGGR